VNIILVLTVHVGTVQKLNLSLFHCSCSHTHAHTRLSCYVM